MKDVQKKGAEKQLGLSMDMIVSGYVYVVTIALVIYMLVTLIDSVQFIVYTISHAPQIVGNSPLNLGATVIENNLLHKIAFAIVLVKAYRILRSYAESHHVNIKYLVEIAIIAPVVEVVFNSNTYSFDMSMLFFLMALGNLIVYLYFYDTLKSVSTDHKKEYEED
jgi:uncharacterized membrane protein (DUF373 family)